MVRKLLSFMMALAVLNLAIFIIVFFWAEFARILTTPHGLFLCSVMVIGAATPVVVTRVGNYQRKRELKKRWYKYKLRQHLEQKPSEPGIDF